MTTSTTDWSVYFVCGCGRKYDKYDFKLIDVCGDCGEGKEKMKAVLARVVTTSYWFSSNSKWQYKEINNGGTRIYENI